MRRAPAALVVFHRAPRDASLAERFCAELEAQAGVPVGFCSLDAPIKPRATHIVPLLFHEGRHLREDIPRIAEELRAQVVAPLPADVVARVAAESVERHTGRRKPSLWVVHDWQTAEALVEALYAHTRRFSWPALAAMRGAPAVADVLRVFRRDGASEVVVQPIAACRAWHEEEVARAAAAIGIAAQVLPGLVENEAFIAALAAHLRKEVGGDSD